VSVAESCQDCLRGGPGLGYSRTIYRGRLEAVQTLFILYCILYHCQQGTQVMEWEMGFDTLGNNLSSSGERSTTFVYYFKHVN
jgi:hypothetical protein